MSSNRLYLLPIIVFVWFPVTFLITFIMAVTLEDVPIIFPYISDTGTFSPESCIFGQMLNMGSILMGVVIYLRYRQIKELSKRHGMVMSIKNINKPSLWLGILAAFGVSIVANFQETNIFSVHILGAFLAFGLGFVYQITETIMYCRMFPKFGDTKIKAVKLALCAVNAVASNLTFVFAVLSLIAFHGKDMTKWKKEDGGYTYHLISSTNEWVTAFCTMAYILTISPDFKKLKVEEPVVSIVDDIVIVPHLIGDSAHI